MKLRRLRIAIVDDEAHVRKALDRLMRGAGFDVETFEDGTPFLASIERAPPDCLVLDLHMPRLSGFEVLDALNEKKSRIPVIVITGHDSPDSAVQAQVAGAFAYLRKPVDGNELLDAITRAATAAAPKA